MYLYNREKQIKAEKMQNTEPTFRRGKVHAYLHTVIVRTNWPVSVSAELLSYSYVYSF